MVEIVTSMYLEVWDAEIHLIVKHLLIIKQAGSGSAGYPWLMTCVPVKALLHCD